MEWNKLQINVNSFWSPIINVKFKHNYYADKLCQDFEVRPTKETMEFLRNHRLLFKAQKDGFVVLCNNDKTKNLLTRGGLEKKKFSFFIKNTNKDFINFSKLPFLDSPTVYYFDNLENNISKEKDKKLHQGDYVGSKDQPQVIIMPFMFSYTPQQLIKRNDLTILNGMGEKIELAERATDDEPLGSHRIDLRGFPEGKYTIKHKSKKIQDFVFFATRDTKGQYFGIIDIYPGIAANKDYQVIRGDKIIPQDFTIHFDNRSTYWKYYIINKQNNINYKYHEVIPKEGSVKFSKPEEVELRNGTPAIRLVSETPIAFMQNQANKFKLNLSKNANGKGNKFSINLPTANISLVKPDRKTQKVYSEIFIYI